MYKTASRWLAVSLSMLLAIDSSAACRWARSCRPAAAACCPAAVAYCPAAEPSCGSCPCPVACPTHAEPSGCAMGPSGCAMGCPAEPASGGDCGCGGSVVESVGVVGSVAEPAMTHSASPTPAGPMVPPTPTPVYEPAPPADAFGGGFRSDSKTEENTEDVPAPAEEKAPSPSDWDAGLDDGAPADKAPAADVPPPAAATTEVQPEVSEPADDLFRDEPPMAEPPMEDAPSGDDLFGDAPAEEPITEDTPPADDLFGEEPPLEEIPAEAVPADDSASADDDSAADDSAAGDDLFGDAPAEEPITEDTPPADDLFGEEAPAEGAPSKDTADDSTADDSTADDSTADDSTADDSTADDSAGDDLFGDAPAEDPTTEDTVPADDLFGEEAPADGAPADDTADDSTAGDDLFGDAPAEEPTTEDTPPADDLFGEEAPADGAPADDAADDLFGEEPEGTDAPADAPQKDTPAEEGATEDDLFGGFGAVLREAGGFASVRERTWIDNTGRFSTVGRLLSIDGAAVRLTKHDGGVATVPLARLSERDLEFVTRQWSAQAEVGEAPQIASGSRPAPQRHSAQASPASNPLRTAQR